MVPSFPIPNAPGVEGVGSGEVRVGRLTVTEMSNEEILNYLRCEMELGTAPFIEQGAGLILSSSRPGGSTSKTACTNSKFKA